jgi:hypothetical protein
MGTPIDAATVRRPPPSEALREAVTMALYVCLVLSAEFVALGELAEEGFATVGLIWGTAVGLALAHVFAFNLAARVFTGGPLAAETRAAAWSQLGAAAAVALVVTVPFLLFPVHAAVEVSAFLLAGLVGLTAFVASREAGAGRARSVLDGVVVLAVAMAIVSIKVAFSGH